MPIPIKELIDAYVNDLDDLLSDSNRLNEAVGWRGIVSEMAWQGQFPKGTAKPEVTLSSLTQHGWIDAEGNLTAKFVYNPSEKTGDSYRYDQERRDFFLTNMCVRDQIALASAYFKGGQDVITHFRQQVAGKQEDAKALQSDIRVIRQLVAQELDSRKFLDNPASLTVNNQFKNKLDNLDKTKIEATVKLISYLENKMQKQIDKYKKSKDGKNAVKEAHAELLKKSVTDYANGSIALAELRQDFVDAKKILKASGSKHKFAKSIKRSLEEIDSYAKKLGIDLGAVSPASQLSDAEKANLARSGAQSPSDDMSSSDEENNPVSPLAAVQRAHHLSSKGFFSESPKSGKSEKYKVESSPAPQKTSNAGTSLFSKRQVPDLNVKTSASTSPDLTDSSDLSKTPTGRKRSNSVR